MVAVVVTFRIGEGARGQRLRPIRFALMSDVSTVSSTGRLACQQRLMVYSYALLLLVQLHVLRVTQ